MCTLGLCWELHNPVSATQALEPKSSSLNPGSAVCICNSWGEHYNSSDLWGSWPVSWTESQAPGQRETLTPNTRLKKNTGGHPLPAHVPMCVHVPFHTCVQHPQRCSLWIPHSNVHSSSWCDRLPPKKFLLSQNAHPQQLSQRGADDVSIPTKTMRPMGTRPSKPSSAAEIYCHGGALSNAQPHACTHWQERASRSVQQPCQGEGQERAAGSRAPSYGAATELGTTGNATCQDLRAKLTSGRLFPKMPQMWTLVVTYSFQTIWLSPKGDIIAGQAEVILLDPCCPSAPCLWKRNITDEFLPRVPGRQHLLE